VNDFSEKTDGTDKIETQIRDGGVADCGDYFQSKVHSEK